MAVSTLCREVVCFKKNEQMQHNLENPFVILLVESVAMQTSVMWDKKDYFSEIQRIRRGERLF